MKTYIKLVLCILPNILHANNEPTFFMKKTLHTTDVIVIKSKKHPTVEVTNKDINPVIETTVSPKKNRSKSFSPYFYEYQYENNQRQLHITLSQDFCSHRFIVPNTTEVKIENETEQNESFSKMNSNSSGKLRLVYRLLKKIKLSKK